MAMHSWLLGFIDWRQQHRRQTHRGQELSRHSGRPRLRIRRQAGRRDSTPWLWAMAGAHLGQPHNCVEDGQLGVALNGGGNAGEAAVALLRMLRPLCLLCLLEATHRHVIGQNLLDAASWRQHSVHHMHRCRGRAQRVVRVGRQAGGAGRGEALAGGEVAAGVGAGRRKPPHSTIACKAGGRWKQAGRVARRQTLSE